ncbi:MAG: helix-turn-helix transcriptional regulator [Sporichthyaceae bacterium]
MSQRRTERLLNLTICLLATRRRLTKEQIRKLVPDYEQSKTEDAFERMFERDKEDLRELGIPIDAGPQESVFADEVGYRIERDAYALPEVRFASDELAVLGLAARAWQQASMSQAAGTALLKLRAAGADPDVAVLTGLEPRVSAAEPAFDALLTACRDNCPVGFDYRGADGVAPARRRIEPWGLHTRNGRWYLVGYDRDRADSRVFRVDRIVGDVRREGPEGSVVVPEGVDVKDQLRTHVAPEVRGSATIAVRTGAAPGLRRWATAVREAGEGWDEIEVPYWRPAELAAELVPYGGGVLVREPAEVRDAVLARLRTLAGVQS